MTATTPVELEVVRAGRALGRRRVLQLMAAAGVGAILPSGCGGAPAALAPPAGASLAVLSPRTYAVMTAAAMRVVGPKGSALVADRTIDVGLLADAWLVRDPAVAGSLGQALLVLEFAVWPLVGKLRPFTALDGATQDAVLTECMTSRFETLRAVFRGVRSLALLTFYGAAASRPLTGFPGPFGSGTVSIADAMRD